MIGVARISTDNLDEKSLDDQEAYYRDWLEREYRKGSYDLRVVAYSGSGQILDLAEFLELSELVQSGIFDLVVPEDLGPILRRIHAVIFCEDARTPALAFVGLEPT